MDGITVIKVQKIAFLIFKSLTLRQKFVLFRKKRYEFFLFLERKEEIFEEIKNKVLQSCCNRLFFASEKNADLRQKIHVCSHFFHAVCAGFLHGCTRVDIGTKRKGCIIVSQIRLYGLDFVSVFQRDRRE